MKNIARSTIIGLSLGAAALMGTAHAAPTQSIGEYLDYPVLKMVSGNSSEQTQQELADAQNKGLISAGAMNDYPYVLQGTPLSRAQVAASTSEWNQANDNFVAY